MNETVIFRRDTRLNGGLILFKDGRTTYTHSLGSYVRDLFAFKLGVSTSTILHEVAMTANMKSQTVDYICRKYRVRVKPNDFKTFLSNRSDYWINYRS